MTQRVMDWGSPRNDWQGPRERISARVSSEVAAALRAKARSEGVSFNTYVQQVLRRALSSDTDPIIDDTVFYGEWTPFT